MEGSEHLAKHSLLMAGVMHQQKSLKWGPWLYHWMLSGGSSALAACDYIGESLANVLGITTPKYQYEIDEYNAILEEVRNDIWGKLI